MEEMSEDLNLQIQTFNNQINEIRATCGIRQWKVIRLIESVN
jgi:hypothetical protein